MAALDSAASVIWLVMSFLTTEAALPDTTNYNSVIPVKTMAVVMLLMRVASLRFTKNFRLYPSAAEIRFDRSPPRICLSTAAALKFLQKLLRNFAGYDILS